MRKALSSQPVIVQLLAAIAVTIIIATASYYLIERPFLKLKNLWSKSRPLATASYPGKIDPAYPGAQA